MVDIDKETTSEYQIVTPIKNSNLVGMSRWEDIICKPELLFQTTPFYTILIL